METISIVLPPAFFLVRGGLFLIHRLFPHWLEDTCLRGGIWVSPSVWRSADTEYRCIYYLNGFTCGRQRRDTDVVHSVKRPFNNTNTSDENYAGRNSISRCVNSGKYLKTEESGVLIFFRLSGLYSRWEITCVNHVFNTDIKAGYSFMGLNGTARPWSSLN